MTRGIRAVAAVALAALPAVGLACEPDGTRYVDQVFTDVDVTSDVEYAVAPGLVDGQPVPLRLDVYEPRGDTLSERSAIVWIHGGGFRAGTKAAAGDVAAAYARRGYVTLSIDYRLDPGNRCQDVQDGVITDPAEYERERARCERAIVAAQHDAQAAVRWVRAHAGTLGVDPQDVAAGGFSAGAVTAVNVAQRSEDPGDVGDDDGQPSTVGAALVASGCNYLPESIGAGDAPLFLLASGGDPAIPFDCVRDTEQRSRAAGLVVDTLYYEDESGHAKKLYESHQAEVDARWTSFLVDNLGLS